MPERDLHRHSPRTPCRVDARDALNSGMPTKVRIIEQIGAKGLLLPELINRGLAANDRLKYYLALLQTAAAHAQAPTQPTSDLRDEREASGVDDVSLDEVVLGAASPAPDTYLIPRAANILQLTAVDLHLMVEPIRVAAGTSRELRDRVDGYCRRVDEQIALMPCSEDDRVSSRLVDGMTRRANGHDSLHQLIMDLHWE